MRIMVSEAGVSDVEETSHSYVWLYPLSKSNRTAVLPTFEIYFLTGVFSTVGCCYIVPLAFALAVRVINTSC